MPAPYAVETGRLILGAIAGAVAALAYFAIQFGPAWMYVVVIGAVPAAIGLVLLVPIYLLLRRWQLLSVYVAVVVGGVLTLIPYALWAVAFQSPLSPYHGVQESLGFLLVKAPAWFFAAGAIGGAVGWLTAIGFRVRPRRRDG